VQFLSEMHVRHICASVAAKRISVGNTSGLLLKMRRGRESKRVRIEFTEGTGIE
jgi:hypothetical protein